MCRVSPALNLTRKKKTLHATEAESERVQNLRKEYWTTIGEAKLSNLVFIRGRNITLIGAIALEGLIASFLFASV